MKNNDSKFNQKPVPLIDEVEYGVEKILKNVPEDHPSSMNLHIK